MKKIIALSILAASMAVPVFGQGWLEVITSRSTAWDGFTTPAGPAALDVNVDVALLWAANNQANPMPGALGNTLATGYNQNPASTAAAVGYTAAAAWNDIYPSGTILSGWTLALDNGDAGTTAGTAIQAATTSKGVFEYNSGLAIDIAGTPAGGNVALMLLAWNSAYATPAAARTAGSAIGWSYLSSFGLASSATSTATTSPTFTSFGTFVPGAVPEPATLALAGLGGLSLLLFRRKKA